MLSNPKLGDTVFLLPPQTRSYSSKTVAPCSITALVPGFAVVVNRHGHGRAGCIQKMSLFKDTNKTRKIVKQMRDILLNIDKGYEELKILRKELERTKNER